MSENDPYTPFKIIAVIPREGCKPEYLKVLQKDQPYYFYRNYKLGKNEELEEDSYLEDLFNKWGPHIEITAIVGKNGSGKSTIMELFFMTINNLTYGNEKIRRDLVYVEKVHVDLYFLTDRFYKIKVDGMSTKAFVFDEKLEQMVEAVNFDFRKLFYTVTINYSHYAYNDLDYPRGQKWLKGVFHKNDAYQIPLVLNPYRDNGNININRENQLVTARLMANLLRPSSDKDFSFRKLSAKFIAVRLRLKLDNSKAKKVLFTRIVESETKHTVKMPDGTFLEEVNIGMLSKIDRPAILKIINTHYPFNHQFEAEKKRPGSDYLYFL